MKVWLNGSMLDGGEAVISVYDHGFLYGLGLFETFRTYGGEPYLAERHLARLLSGCAELGIPFGMDAAELRERVRELLAVNGLADGYIRLTVSAGDGELGLPLGDYSRPTVLLLAKALPVVSDEALRRGKELRLLRTRRNSPESAVRFKSLHYMNNIIAKREMLGLVPVAAEAGGEQGAEQGGAYGAANGAPIAEQDGASGELGSKQRRAELRVPSTEAGHGGAYDTAFAEQGGATGMHGEEQRRADSQGTSPQAELCRTTGKLAGGHPRAAASLPSPGAEGLMLSREGWLAEGIVSNLFFVSEGVVRTPAIVTGILPGVTRARVLELAREAGYSVEEGLYGWEELLGADEVWLTNSIQELVPVTRLSDWHGLMQQVGSGEAGPLTLKLLAMYRADTKSATM